MCSISLAISAGMSLFQGYQQNQQAKSQAKYQEQVGRANQREAQNQATRISNEGVRKENVQRRATAEMASRQKATLGAKGVVVNSGSAEQLQSDTIELGNLDSMQIRENAKIQADTVSRQGDVNLWKSNAEAGQTRAKGRSSLIGGALNAASTVVSSKWYTGKSAATTANYDINSNSSLQKQRYA